MANRHIETAPGELRCRRGEKTLVSGDSVSPHMFNVDAEGKHNPAVKNM